MTSEELFVSLAGAFPKVEKSKAEVKGYLTLRLLEPADLVPVVSWLKERGFDYLDMVTAVDYKCPVDAKGFITDPNANAFLADNPRPGIEVPAAVAGFPYRDTFELVYCLTSLKEKLKVFAKVEIPRGAAKMPSLAALFSAADWQEREVFDLLGIVFEGHPNLTKILTPDFIQGHPLRKDYVHVADRFD